MAWTALIPLGASLISGIMGASKAKKADKAAKDALTFKQRQYAERAPFRQYALQGLGQMGKPIDSSFIFQNKANPFSRGRDFSRDLGAEMRAPMVRPQAPAQQFGGGGGGAMAGGLDPYELQRLTPLGMSGGMV